MSETFEMRQSIMGTDDKELDAIKFIMLSVRDLDTDAKWRVIDYATKKIQSEVYGNQNIEMGEPKL